MKKVDHFKKDRLTVEGALNHYRSFVALLLSHLKKQQVTNTTEPTVHVLKNNATTTKLCDLLAIVSRRLIRTKISC